MSPPLDADLKALAALVSASFGFLVLASAPKQLRSQVLAAFLFLIAGNQAAEAMRALAPTEEAQLYWFRIATAFAALDPLVLLWFGSVSVGGERLHRARVLLPAVAVSGGFAVAAIALPSIPSDFSLFASMLSGFTALVYLSVAFVVAPATITKHGAREGALMLTALGIAAVPVVSSLAAKLATTGTIIPLGIKEPTTFPIQLAASVAAALLVLMMLRRSALRAVPVGASGDRLLRAGILVTAAVTAVPLIAPLMGTIYASTDVDHAYNLFGQATAPVRWLLFGSLVSVVFLRYETLSMGLAARRRAARVLITLGVLTLAAIIVTTSQFFVGLAIQVQPIEGAVLAGAIVLSQGFRGFVDRVAELVYGVPMRGDLVARHAAYRAAASQAAAVGRGPTSDAALARLRDELEIDPPTAALLERIAEGSSADPLQPGRRVAGRYLVEEMIGRGGSGRAFRARDEVIERDVVLKEVPAGGDDARSLHEARAAGAIQHPNVLVVHDVLQRVGSTILVTEYAPGGSLESLLREGGPLGPAAAWPMLEGTIAGVAAVHARGIVHGDIKPGNVLLTANGSPKVADFGVARLAQGSTVDLRLANSFVGTPGYMAPEQRRGAEATPASDVYALGALARAIFARPVPPEIEALVRVACADEPTARYGDAGEMLVALQRELAHLTPSREGAPGPHR